MALPNLLLNEEMPSAVVDEVLTLSYVLAGIAILVLQFGVLASLRRRNRRLYFEEISSINFRESRRIRMRPGLRLLHLRYEDLATPQLGIAGGLIIAASGLFMTTRGAFLVPAIGLFLALVGAQVAVGALRRLGSDYLCAAEIEHLRRHNSQPGLEHAELVQIESSFDDSPSPTSTLLSDEALRLPEVIAKRLADRRSDLSGETLLDSLTQMAAPSGDSERKIRLSDELAHLDHLTPIQLPLYWILRAGILSQLMADSSLVREALTKAFLAMDNPPDWASIERAIGDLSDYPTALEGDEFRYLTNRSISQATRSLTADGPSEAGNV